METTNLGPVIWKLLGQSELPHESDSRGKVVLRLRS